MWDVVPLSNWVVEQNVNPQSSKQGAFINISTATLEVCSKDTRHRRLLLENVPSNYVELICFFLLLKGNPKLGLWHAAEHDQ